MFKNPKEIFCPKCNKYIPSESAVCPKCGYTITDEARKKAIKSTARINIFSAVVLVLLILGGINYFTGSDGKTEGQQPVQTAENGEHTFTVTDGDSSESGDENISYTVLPYSFADKMADTKNGRAWARYDIILEEKDNAKINAETLIATVAGAAKHYAKADNKKIVQVIMFDQKGTDWGHIQLARITYSPDGKGFGSDSWYWNDFIAVERTTTPQEKAVCKAWNSMRKDFQTAAGTDEEKLTQAVAKKLNIPAEQVNLPYLIGDKIKLDFSRVKAQAPTK